MAQARRITRFRCCMLFFAYFSPTCSYEVGRSLGPSVYVCPAWGLISGTRVMHCIKCYDSESRAVWHFAYFLVQSPNPQAR